MTSREARSGPAGVVLCGGSSTRMGRDKATMTTPSGPLAGVAARALQDAGCDPVVLVGGDGGALRSRLDLRWIADSEPGAGPLGGIASAVDHLAGRALIVSACDLPDLRGSDVSPLRDAIRSGNAEVAVYDRDGRPQWSVLALGPAAATAMAAAFAAGERALHRAVATVATAGLVVVRLDPPRPEGIGDADRVEDLPDGWPTMPPGSNPALDRIPDPAPGQASG